MASVAKREAISKMNEFYKKIDPYLDKDSTCPQCNQKRWLCYSDGNVWYRCLDCHNPKLDSWSAHIGRHPVPKGSVPHDIETRPFKSGSYLKHEVAYRRKARSMKYTVQYCDTKTCDKDSMLWTRASYKEDGRYASAEVESDLVKAYKLLEKCIENWRNDDKRKHMCPMRIVDNNGYIYRVYDPKKDHRLISIRNKAIESHAVYLWKSEGKPSYGPDKFLRRAADEVKFCNGILDVDGEYAWKNPYEEDDVLKNKEKSDSDTKSNSLEFFVEYNQDKMCKVWANSMGHEVYRNLAEAEKKFNELANTSHAIRPRRIADSNGRIYRVYDPHRDTRLVEIRNSLIKNHSQFLCKKSGKAMSFQNDYFAKGLEYLEENNGIFDVEDAGVYIWSTPYSFIRSERNEKSTPIKYHVQSNQYRTCPESGWKTVFTETTEGYEPLINRDFVFALKSMTEQVEKNGIAKPMRVVDNFGKVYRVYDPKLDTGIKSIREKKIKSLAASFWENDGMLPSDGPSASHVRKAESEVIERDGFCAILNDINKYQWDTPYDFIKNERVEVKSGKVETKGFPEFFDINKEGHLGLAKGPIDLAMTGKVDEPKLSEGGFGKVGKLENPKIMTPQQQKDQMQKKQDELLARIAFLENRLVELEQKKLEDYLEAGKSFTDYFSNHYSVSYFKNERTRTQVMMIFRRTNFINCSEFINDSFRVFCKGKCLFSTFKDDYEPERYDNVFQVKDGYIINSISHQFGHRVPKENFVNNGSGGIKYYRQVHFALKDNKGKVICDIITAPLGANDEYAWFGRKTAATFVKNWLERNQYALKDCECKTCRLSNLA